MRQRTGTLAPAAREAFGCRCRDAVLRKSWRALRIVRGLPVELDHKPQPSPDAAHQPVGDEAILINLKTGTYYSLNETGTMFWQLLDGQRTIADCARLIALDYEAELELVEADLLELATDLKKEGLIVL